MSVFPFIHFFNAMVYSYLGVYIYGRNPKSLINRICASFFVCFTIWSFGLVIIHNPASSKESALVWTDINALGWAAFPGLFLWFTLAFTEKEEILKKKWFLPITLGVSLLMVCSQWADLLLVELVKMDYGWKPVYGDTIWPYVFALYVVGFVSVGLYSLYTYMRSIRSLFLKKQAQIVFVTVVISLMLGAFSDIFLPLAGYHKIPNIGDTTSLIWVFGFIYALVKYNFLTITPATAAENIISTMFDCLILLDLEGRIVRVNNAAVNLLGYSEKEFKGMELRELLPDGGPEHAQWSASVLQEEKIDNKDFSLKTKTGNTIPVLFSSSILKDSTGTSGGIVCIAKDIRERKKLEEETLKSKKLESVGILAGGIAHDFNNILSVIMGNISLAKESIPGGDSAGNLLDNAQNATEMAANLAAKFITFSKGGWLNKEKIVLSSLLKNLKVPGLAVGHFSSVSAVDPHPLELTQVSVNLPANLMPISGDREQLVQVMQNLLQNAGDAVSQRRGNITVSAENVHMEEHSGLPLQKGTYVKIMIRDNGEGIEPQVLPRVFDPYFSTKSLTVQRGLGLGLTVCYSIVKKHGGYIEIESEPGKGTSVTVYLPAWHMAPIL